MPALRIVFFGGLGPYSALHLDAVARAYGVVGAVCGLERADLRGRVGRMLRSLGLRRDPFADACRRHGVRRWLTERSDARVVELVSTLQPDLICVAGYPRRLRPAVWKAPPLGTLNSHASLLPRHRGVLPLFWIYYHGDEETGVTVHRVTDRVDAGDIVAQERYSLPRGFPVDRLSAINAERGSRLLVNAIQVCESRSVQTRPQNESEATLARRVPPGTAMVDFDWDVARVWHFLAGLCPRFIEPLRDDRGRPAGYGSVLGFERAEHRESIGTVRATDTGWLLHCQGGVVRLAPRQR